MIGLIMENKRLEDLETTIYHMNSLIQDLNKTVNEQQLSIYKLEKKLDKITEQVMSVELSNKDDNPTQKPPHY